MIFGLIIWGVVTLAGMFFRWLWGLSAGMLLLFLVVGTIADKTNIYMREAHPYHGESNHPDMATRLS